MIKWVKNKLSGCAQEDILPSGEFEILSDILDKERQQKQDEPLVICSDEKEMLKEIKRVTLLHNKNNITRTAAYLAYYLRHPDIHWSFLAHIVSRNAGYHMSDLKGDLMNRLFSDQEKELYFTFLESANSAIFADVYPQLLLYEKTSKKENIDSRFFKAFGISRFMPPIWQAYLRTNNSRMLTAALIINEQMMLEHRVLHHASSKAILDSLRFRIQEHLGLTKIIFPLNSTSKKLAGMDVQDFGNPFSRILTGKTLYKFLFSSEGMQNTVRKYAQKHPHTGSRADYWDHVFSVNKKGIYSPPILNVWPELTVPKPYVRMDWFKDQEILPLLKTLPVCRVRDISKASQKQIVQLYLLNKAGGLADS